MSEKEEKKHNRSCYDSLYKKTLYYIADHFDTIDQFEDFIPTETFVELTHYYAWLHHPKWN